MAAAAGFLLGFPVLRLRGDYLAIVTLGFGEIVRILLLNNTEITGGPNGISQIPKPTFFGLEFSRTAREGGWDTFSNFFGLKYDPSDRVIFLYLVALLLVVLSLFVINRLLRMPLGRAWEALREDEIACRSLGLSPRRIKLTAFTIRAAFEMCIRDRDNRIDGNARPQPDFTAFLSHAHPERWSLAWRRGP